jgi:protein involved in ribonucleotide reduction
MITLQDEGLQRSTLIVLVITAFLVIATVMVGGGSTNSIPIVHGQVGQYLTVCNNDSCYPITCSGNSPFYRAYPFLPYPYFSVL